MKICLQKQIFEIFFIGSTQMVAFLYYNPHESINDSTFKNVCLAEIRRIEAEKHFCTMWYGINIIHSSYVYIFEFNMWYLMTNRRNY